MSGWGTSPGRTEIPDPLELLRMVAVLRRSRDRDVDDPVAPRDRAQQVVRPDAAAVIQRPGDIGRED